MKDTTLKFLDEEYSFPPDILTYIDLLDFTDSVKNQLIEDFVRKVANFGMLDDKNFINEMEQQVGKFIAKLCDNNIFTRTIVDYLKNNNGYQLYSDVNKAALNKSKSMSINKLDELKEGYDNAISNAESHITGMGFSVWSSSFVNNAIYAAMESSTLKKQREEAERQYKKEMSDLHSRLNSKYSAEESYYIKNIYIPNMETAFTVFAFELLDKYVADLIVHDKFDRKTLEFVDINRSNDLLKNLSITNNKAAILKNAFLACPYNIDVYMKAIEYELLDTESFQTSVVFKQSEKILSFLRNNFGEVLYPEKFTLNYEYINLYASFTNQSYLNLLNTLTNDYVSRIINEYMQIYEMIDNNELCCKALAVYSIDDILSGSHISKHEANRRVKSIVKPEVWSQLIYKCGHKQLFEKIKNLDINVKDDFDNYLVEKLEYCLENARQSLVPIVLKEKQENEAAIEKQKKECKKAKNIYTIIMILLLVIPVLVHIVLVSVWCKNAKSIYSSQIEEGLNEELADNASLCYKAGLTEQFDVESVSYYKSRFGYMIAEIHLTLYTTKTNVDTNVPSGIVHALSDHISTKDIGTPWYVFDGDSPYLHESITVVGADGSTVTFDEFTPDEDEHLMFVYLPFWVAFFYGIYAFLVVFTIKKRKNTKTKKIINNYKKSI